MHKGDAAVIARRPSGRRSNPKALRLLRPCFVHCLAMTILFFGTLLVNGSFFAFSEEISMRIDGKVIRVDEAKRLLTIDFEHPATGIHEEKKFFVSEDAGFKDFKKLNELREGDLVSLDYFDYKPTPKVVYVIHIPLKKVFFTHKEVAEALVKIKSGAKENGGKKS